MAAVSVIHFSDVLCVWAYVGQIKVDELRRHFGERIALETRFVPVFGDTTSRLAAWKDRGGAAGYARHVREIVARFGHVDVHDDVWAEVVPAGSWTAHAYARAAALASAKDAPDDGSGGEGPLERLVWRMRVAFFAEARDVSQRTVLDEIAADCGWSPETIHRHLDDGGALAALAADHDLCSKNHVTGSPTFVFNAGRQQIYGDVGYRIIEANVEELLRDNSDRASWC